MQSCSTSTDTSLCEQFGGEKLVFRNSTLSPAISRLTVSIEWQRSEGCGVQGRVPGGVCVRGICSADLRSVRGRCSGLTEVAKHFSKACQILLQAFFRVQLFTMVDDPDGAGVSGIQNGLNHRGLVFA